MSQIRTSPTTPRRAGHTRARGIAVASSAVITLLYGSLFLSLLTIEGASDGERGILGVAAGVFAVLTTLLWVKPHRVVLAGGAALQVLLGWMYVAIAPDRDPSFEVWGLTIRALSLVLLIALVTLLLADRRGRSTAP